MRLLITALPLAFAVTLRAAEEQAGIDPLERARREFRQGHVDAALSILIETEKHASPTVMTLDLRGCIHLEQRKFEDAVAAFKAAQATKERTYLPRLHLGDAFLRQGKWAEARDTYESLLKETDILAVNERMRYAIFLTYLGAKDEAGAKAALDRVPFPTETAAYYYAQAGWSFARGSKRAGEKWMRTADHLFDAQKSAWFARPLYEFGWVKTKPPLVFD